MQGACQGELEGTSNAKPTNIPVSYDTKLEGMSNAKPTNIPVSYDTKPNHLTCKIRSLPTSRVGLMRQGRSSPVQP